jgi:hypothetical protein
MFDRFVSDIFDITIHSTVGTITMIVIINSIHIFHIFHIVPAIDICYIIHIIRIAVSCISRFLVAAGLGAMLETAVEEQLHGVLEALAALVEATPSADAALEGAIAPHILTVWRANITDPLITSSALEVFSSLAKNAKCLSSLQVHFGALLCAHGLLTTRRCGPPRQHMIQCIAEPIV